MSWVCWRSSLALVALLLAAADVEGKNRLRVVHPQALAGDIEQRPSLFGKPSNGRSLNGVVFLPPESERSGCGSISKPESNFSTPNSSTPFAFMLWRGGCTFVEKVRNAQAAGASAVIVVNNVDGVIPAMQDDGSGSNIVTPAMIIGKMDGDRILKFVGGADKSPVVVSMEFSVLTKTVDYTLWTSCVDARSAELKSVLGKMNSLLDTKAIFQPRYFVVSGSLYGCTRNNSCGNQCTNNGRYCAIDPDLDTQHGISGRQVVEENLRQICIAAEAKKQSDMGLWFAYVNAFQRDCVQNKIVTKECHRQTMETIGQSKYIDNVEQCVRESGGSGSNAAINRLLDEEIQARVNGSIHLMPTLTINGDVYYGRLNCPSPLDLSHCEALAYICRSFQDGFEPKLCAPSRGCAIGQMRDACDRCLDINSDEVINDPSLCPITETVGISGGAIFGTVSLFLALLMIAAFAYHRYSTSKMNDELRGIMSQYVPLSHESVSDQHRLLSSDPRSEST